MKVLLIATLFPPRGGPGALRNVKFVKYLWEDHGVQTVVLTAREVIGGSQRFDDSLSDQLPKETAIYRPRSFGMRLMQLLYAKAPPIERLVRFFLVPDRYISWAPAAVLVGWRAARQHNVDVIYTSSQPNSLTLVGWALKRLLGKPWVADFRDPWTQHHSFAPLTPLHNVIHHWLERRLLARADRIIANTEGNRARLLEKYPQLPAGKVVTIPNGYDSLDFQSDSLPRPQETTALPPTAGDAFTIVHVGSFYDSGLPVTSRDRFFHRIKQRLLRRTEADPRNTSSPRQILLAIRALLDRRPLEQLPRKLRLVFVGPFPPGYESFIRQLHLSDVVQVVGRVPHDEALRRMVGADALLLVLAQSEAAKSWVPAKTYEYLYARRPVLALVPEGEARRILRAAGVGIAVDPDDIQGIAAAVEKLLADGFQVDHDDRVIANYDRRVLTARLKTVFDEAVAGIAADGPTTSQVLGS